jgi:hypothetical protein
MRKRLQTFDDKKNQNNAKKISDFSGRKGNGGFTEALA